MPHFKGFSGSSAHLRLLGAVIFGAGVSAACASRAPAEPVAPHAAGVPERAARESAAELTEDEVSIRERLRRHEAELTALGERNPNHPWELAGAADYLAAEFEALGYPVERNGYEASGVAAQNLAVTVGGGRRGDQIFVVGAHYDSPPDGRGENAGGSATAALLELARLMRGARLERTLKIVAFALGEEPHAQGEERGSVQYLKWLTTDDTRLVGFLHLDRLGSFEKNPDSSLRLDWAASPGAEGLAGLVLEGLEGAPFRLEEVSRSWLAPAGGGDAGDFFRAGVPTVALSGDGKEGAVDLDALARIVHRLRFSVVHILGDEGTNDGMLTPGLGALR